MPDNVQVDIISDVICPWCFIGKRRFEKALDMRPELSVDVRWRPYQLDATIPKEGIPRSTYLERKFGGKEKIRSIYSRIEQAGAAEGIAFAFDRIMVTPNTIDPHRLIRWAATAGMQDEMVERLFTLYFIEGVDVGDPDVLAQTADDVGLDRNLVSELLGTESDVELVEKEVALASRMGVTGVPCFVFANRFAVMGAQSPEIIADALDRAVDQ